MTVADREGQTDIWSRTCLWQYNYKLAASKSLRIVKFQRYSIVHVILY